MPNLLHCRTGFLSCASTEEICQAQIPGSVLAPDVLEAESEGCCAAPKSGAIWAWPGCRAGQGGSEEEKGEMFP